MRKSPVYDSLKKWLGTGILTSSGTKWQTRRKILTPAFHFKILQDFIEIFNEKTEEMVEVLKRECDKTCTEITPIITHFALKVIGGEEIYIYVLD
jgi:cytochrome P450